jgi:hypothetical protein
MGSVRSWSDLCRQFISNFRATCERPGVKWDLANIMQEEGESLQKFIQRFYNKRNVIPEVDDKSIIMFFKKGLNDSALIRKLAMKNLRTSEEMLTIANKYALAEEATFDNKEAKRDKKPSHSDRPGTSRSNDKKGNPTALCPMWSGRYATGLSISLGRESSKISLTRSVSFTLKGSTRLWDYNHLQGFADEVLNSAKRPSKTRSPKIQSATSPKLARRSTTSTAGPTPTCQRRSEAYSLGGHDGRTRHSRVPEVVRCTYYLRSSPR